ncbi:MAG: MFS transporter [Deltaproteobacteria bacterium]|nr:MFS transporter [Deltaproteobacteria bacterium]
MFENKAYWAKALPVVILGIFLFYFYSGLQNDHLNVLLAYYLPQGWTSLTITNPVTWATIVVIPATVLIGALMIKYSVTKVIVPSAVILALSCVGLAFSNLNVIMFSVFLFLIRFFVVPLQMGGMMLCTNWFINLRGRALGFVTMGCPLFTATGIVSMSYGVKTIGFTMTYIIVGFAVLLLGILVAIFVKSKPEDVGLYPDGADSRPVSTTGEIKSLPFKVVFSDSGSWLLVISYGLLQACIVAMMAFYVTRLDAVGTDPKIYYFWLSAAAIGGIPISYLLGEVDDRFGTITASYVLCATFLMALAALLFMTANNIPLIILAALGLAGVMGGTPTLHPSITAYVWGRDRYQAANRWIMAIQAIMMALSLPFMSIIFDITGTLNLAYEIMMGFVFIAVICLFILGRKPDYDRSQEA